MVNNDKERAMPFDYELEMDRYNGKERDMSDTVDPPVNPCPIPSAECKVERRMVFLVGNIQVYHDGRSVIIDDANRMHPRIPPDAIPALCDALRAARAEGEAERGAKLSEAQRQHIERQVAATHAAIDGAVAIARAWAGKSEPAKREPSPPAFSAREQVETLLGMKWVVDGHGAYLDEKAHVSTWDGRGHGKRATWGLVGIDAKGSAEDVPTAIEDASAALLKRVVNRA